MRRVERREFLRYSVGVAAGLIAGPAAWSGAASAAPLPFVDDYATNTTANLTAETNAAVRILSGMSELWKTGPTWDSGIPVRSDVLAANIRYVAEVTAARTPEEAKQSFIIDRRHQSYSIADGLGPLTPLYREGAKSVTGVLTAPDGTPPDRVNDAVPPDAPVGSAIGAGSPTSELGLVVQLINTVRGDFTSSNPSKLAYQYPRPWRLREDNQVVDTGAVDEYGYPVYDSPVLAAPQLLRQRSTVPADDGGFVSGHTNALYLAALGLAYAVPERFQELLACATAYAHTRIVAGMHSPLDVIGGRTLGTALAAAVLSNTRFAELKTAARAQAQAYFQARTGTTDLFGYAHGAGLDTDPYADRAVNRASVTPRLTYILERQGRTVPLTVPKGAEVLLETRLPYLREAQRRAVLRTTALPSGYPLLDGPESWGRLNLFAAADGYGAFENDVYVDMDATAGGFSAADAWRNDIDGDGALVKRGAGALTLSGDNRYRGGTRVTGGTLVAAAPRALGTGDVEVRDATLRIAAGSAAVKVRGEYRQGAGGVLDVTLAGPGQAALAVSGPVRLHGESALEVRFAGEVPPAGATLPVLRANGLVGRFGRITVHGAGVRAVPLYTANGVWLRFPSA
ncbi:phosphatase PAP2 family protein [Actinomycetes bacterium KLBMP 9797]